MTEHFHLEFDSAGYPHKTKEAPVTTKIIAFDPGARWTGICALTVEDGRPVKLYLGQIEDPQKSTMPRRVRGFLDDSEVVWSLGCKTGRVWGSDRLIIAVEKSIPPKAQAYNWELTSRVRGAIQSFVTDAMAFHELTAREVRSALGIKPLSKRSKASLKQAHVRGVTQDAQVKEALCRYCGLAPVLLKSTHQVDALALAVVVGWRHYGLQLEEMKKNAHQILTEAK